jgi:hypothetical protein
MRQVFKPQIKINIRCKFPFILYKIIRFAKAFLQQPAARRGIKLFLKISLEGSQASSGEVSKFF